MLKALISKALHEWGSCHLSLSLSSSSQTAPAPPPRPSFGQRKFLCCITPPTPNAIYTNTWRRGEGGQIELRNCQNLYLQTFKIYFQTEKHSFSVKTCNFPDFTNFVPHQINSLANGFKERKLRVNILLIVILTTSSPTDEEYDHEDDYECYDSYLPVFLVSVGEPDYGGLSVWLSNQI